MNKKECFVLCGVMMGGGQGCGGDVCELGVVDQMSEGYVWRNESSWMIGVLLDLGGNGTCS